MKKYVFFRNDDVRGTLDHNLVRLTDVTINNRIPISHAVEPGNVSKEVVNWLLSSFSKNPGLIEIIQHGFDHSLNFRKVVNGTLKKGEFGGDRGLDEQFEEILRGKKLMDQYFGNHWFPAFTFPYGARNRDAVLAVAKAGFKVVHGSMSPTVPARLFYSVGRMLRRETLAQRKVSWHLKKRFKTQLLQIDTSISVIKKFIDEKDACIFDTLDSLIQQVEEALAVYDILGIVLHHRYHINEESFQLVDDLIRYLKSKPEIIFTNQENLYFNSIL